MPNQSYQVVDPLHDVQVRDVRHRLLEQTLVDRFLVRRARALHYPEIVRDLDKREELVEFHFNLVPKKDLDELLEQTAIVVLVDDDRLGSLAVLANLTGEIVDFS